MVPCNTASGRSSPPIRPARRGGHTKYYALLRRDEPGEGLSFRTGCKTKGRRPDKEPRPFVLYKKVVHQTVTRG